MKKFWFTTFRPKKFLLESVYAELEKLHSVSQALQRENGICLSDAHKLFRKLLDCHSELSRYLGLDITDTISKNPTVEIAIAKFIEKLPITAIKREKISKFIVPDIQKKSIKGCFLVIFRIILAVSQIPVIGF